MSKKIEVNGRLFNIYMIRAKNGCFLIVCEGEEMKFGSMALSLKIENRASSNIIIPSKFEDFYSRIFSENISMIIDGIVIVSLYTITPIDVHIAKRLLEGIKELCKT